MSSITNLLIGIAVLILGYPIGIFLARVTKEELASGRKYFRIIVFLSLIGGVGLILGNDILLFSMFFVAIVTSRSLRKK